MSYISFTSSRVDDGAPTTSTIYITTTTTHYHSHLPSSFIRSFFSLTLSLSATALHNFMSATYSALQFQSSCPVFVATFDHFHFHFHFHPERSTSFLIFCEYHFKHVRSKLR
ncbi:hypothetical protein Dsin_019230 [Dipteronia sinensis]|uniref:Uncharacterized protein n=1 Tax=Dipteronia sinensis TaxID=43782 RepID=A0AAE0E3V1_9ROSI|nr:hypothetical protein Dsin_019230 [Dipteronia sinensis]